MKKYSVEIGTIAKFVFHKLVARVVALSGTQPKFEVASSFYGKVVDIQWDKAQTRENGKPDYTVTIQDLNDSRVQIVTKVSNIAGIEER